MNIDLAPFGFTATESRVYNELLNRGPTSAYSLSKNLSIARANVYQALNGLVTKQAAILSQRAPQIFRPIGPTDVLALVSQQQAARLDSLERQVASWEPRGVPSVQDIGSERSFREMALRTAVRAERVRCLGTASMLRSLLPIWRKRLAEQVVTELWVTDTSRADLGREIAVTAIRESPFGRTPAVLVTSETMLAGNGAGPDFSGYWSTAPILVVLANQAFDSLRSP